MENTELWKIQSLPSISFKSPGDIRQNIRSMYRRKTKQWKFREEEGHVLACTLGTASPHRGAASQLEGWGFIRQKRTIFISYSPIFKPKGTQHNPAFSIDWRTLQPIPLPPWQKCSRYKWALPPCSFQGPMGPWGCIGWFTGVLSLPNACKCSFPSKKR